MDWLKELLKKAGIADDKLDGVIGDVNKELPKHMIPKDKFNTVSEEIKELKKQLAERDTQLETLKGKAAGNEDLLKQIDQLKADNKKTKDDYEATLKQQAKDFAVDKAIAAAKGKNPKAIKALLDLEKVSLDGENVIGLKEQIDALAKSDAYLFGDDKKGPIGSPGSPGPGDPPDPVAAAKQLAEERNKGTQAPAGGFDPWGKN